MHLESDEDVNAFDALPSPSVLPVRTMLTDFETINVLAPLVRCSKLPFRHLCSLYETHVTHTPMILAEEFSRSQSARVSDFSTSRNERGVFWMEPRQRLGSSSKSISQASLDSHPEDHNPKVPSNQTTISSNRLPPTVRPPTRHSQLIRGALIAQFASPNSMSLADAAELISPYVDGLDVNCGCPQKWAYHEGIGCALLRKPELVRDMIRQVKGRVGWEFPVSIKIRVDPDLKYVRRQSSFPRAFYVVLTSRSLTDQLVKTALHVDVSHITIHGRTRHQASSEPVSLPGIKFAVEAAKGEVPCVANGDLWDSSDAARMREETGVRGVMGARGLLAKSVVILVAIFPHLG